MAQANLKTIPAEPSGQDAPDMLARITAELERRIAERYSTLDLIALAWRGMPVGVSGQAKSRARAALDWTLAMHEHAQALREAHMAGRPVRLDSGSITDASGAQRGVWPSHK